MLYSIVDTPLALGMEYLRDVTQCMDSEESALRLDGLLIRNHITFESSSAAAEIFNFYGA